VLLVPVAAILVAGIRLSFLDMSGARDGDRRAVFGCDVALRKGDEMGWFEHGSTIIVLAPAGAAMADGLREGDRLRMGQPLLRLAAGCG
jgi:phosphatidylserine decarboxylase